MKLCGHAWQNCIIGPIPTVLRFFLSPFYRVEVFITEEVLASGKKKVKAQTSPRYRAHH